jgi:hypothetical protein
MLPISPTAHAGHREFESVFVTLLSCREASDRACPPSDREMPFPDREMPFPDRGDAFSDRKIPFSDREMPFPDREMCPCPGLTYIRMLIIS